MIRVAGTGGLVLLALLALACGGQQEAPAANDHGHDHDGADHDHAAELETTTPGAVAVLLAKSGSGLTGTAMFSAEDGQVRLVLEVQGVEPGDHAVHLHQVGDCSSDDGKSAGGHWNPTGEDHGEWGHNPFHLGDIGNLVIGEDGAGTIELTTDRWSIGSGADNDILGRSVIVHAGVDDFTTQPTGAAGGRIGCGVVETR